MHSLASRILGVCVVSAVLSVGPVFAVDLRFEAAVPYETGKMIELGAKVGDVEVNGVEFSELAGTTSVGGKIAGGLGKLRGSDSTTKAALQVAFECVNLTTEDWEVTFTIDLLDAEGELIDRVTRDEDFRKESKIYKIQHEILAYVVPLIVDVKIRLDAELD